MPSRGHLLLDCLHRDAGRVDAARLSALSRAEWDDLLGVAAEQRVRPLLQRRLGRPDLRDHVPPRVRDALRAACLTIARHNLDLHAALVTLLDRFAAGGVPVVLLKGVHLASAFYGDIALREIGDIDVLVRRDQLARAAALAIDDGFAARKPFDVDLDAAAFQHISLLFKPPHTVLEVHWNISDPRAASTIEPDPLWRRAETVRVFGREALALGPEDLLLHLCEHMGGQHRFEFGIRPLCDLSVLIERRGAALNWDEVRTRAAAWGWSPSVVLCLRLARDLIGVPVPAAAADALGLDRLPADVVTAAAEQLAATAAAPRDVPRRRLAALHGAGLRETAVHLRDVLFESRTELRRIYPDHPRHPLVWWTVYVRRFGDLARRDARMLARAFLVRDPAVQSTLGRQRRLAQFLSTGR